MPSYNNELTVCLNYILWLTIHNIGIFLNIMLKGKLNGTMS